MEVITSDQLAANQRAGAEIFFGDHTSCRTLAYAAMNRERLQSPFRSAIGLFVRYLCLFPGLCVRLAVRPG